MHYAAFRVWIISKSKGDLHKDSIWVLIFHVACTTSINCLEVLVAVRLERLRKEASVCHFWGAVRLAAALLRKIYPSVTHITTILVQGCQVMWHSGASSHSPCALLNLLCFLHQCGEQFWMEFQGLVKECSQEAIPGKVCYACAGIRTLDSLWSKLSLLPHCQSWCCRHTDNTRKHNRAL